jgi:hypothetical protein
LIIRAPHKSREQLKKKHEPKVRGSKASEPTDPMTLMEYYLTQLDLNRLVNI